MPPEIWRIAVDVAQFVATSAVAVYVYFASHAQARREALERLENRLDQRLDELDSQLTSIDSRVGNSPTLELCAVHRGRVDTVERLLAELPGHDAMNRVHARIDEVSALASEVRGRLTGIERTLDTISQHLLEQRRSRD